MAQLFQIAYQFTDAFWVGRLGGDAIAAVALSMPLIFLLISVGIGLAIAGSTLTAQYFGAKDEKNLSQAAGQTLLMIISVSLVFSVLGFFLAPQLLQLLGAEPQILATASSYLKIAFLGMLFNFSFFVFQAIMRSIGKAKIPVYIVLGTVILNFILDPIFMFGFGPIPALGVRGAAATTIITQMIAAIIGLSILFNGKHGIKVHYHNFIPDFKFIKKAFFLGLPASIEQSTRSLSLVVTTGFIAAFGTLAVAAYGVGSNIFQLMLMMGFGLSGANSALVGQSIGANNPKKAREFATISLKTALIFFSLSGLIIYIFAPYFIRFFVPGEADVIAAGANYLRLVSPAFLIIGLQVIIAGSLQASGNTKTPMYLTIASQWLLQLPLIYFLPKLFNLGLNGIWLSFPISGAITAIAYFYIFRTKKWEYNKIITEKDQTKGTISQEAEIETAVPL